jgi:SAM-dependent methyltransferase
MADHDSWARTYPTFTTPRPPNAHLVTTLVRLRLKPGRALDLGCGSGRHLPVLAQHGQVPIGIDPSASALMKCRQFVSGFALAQATVERLPFASERFDLVVAWGLLFHLRPHELPGALNEIRRMLAPGGTAILHTLDPSDWRAAKRNASGVIGRFYAPQEISAMLAPYFEIVSRELVHTQHDDGRSAEWIFVARPIP